MEEWTEQLPCGVWIRPTRTADSEQLAELQQTVFPTLADAQRLKAVHYRHHIKLFPQGQYAALRGSRIVGMTTSIRLEIDWKHPGHSFDEVFRGGWLDSHQPEGAWLYGIDVGVEPSERRQGIARALYRARQHSVRSLSLRGQVTVGMLSGFGALSESMSAEQYVQELRDGCRVDPTISAQLKIGFELRELILDYLEDPVCANTGILLVLPAEREI